MPKLYIDEFVGITNRLETLPLAFAIRKAYGHEIILDWHELDSFSVEDTRRGKVRLLARLGALRVRHCDTAQFANLCDKKIILRSLNGPPEILDPIYLETASKIHLNPSLATEIRALFAPVQTRPLVGVHIRHGDYRLPDAGTYRIEGVEWPAVPVWWYEQSMAAITRQQKDVCFFLSSTGDPSTYAALHRNFDVLTLDVDSPYHYKGPDHESRVNPVADLFALACCPVILATPISGYSHWAANVLGSASTCIVPLPGATRDQALKGAVNLYASRLPRWRTAGRSGTDTTAISDAFENIDLTHCANVGWL